MNLTSCKQTEDIKVIYIKCITKTLLNVRDKRLRERGKGPHMHTRNARILRNGYFS